MYHKMVQNGTFLGQKGTEKGQAFFYCQKCDFSTSHIGHWRRHLETKKHNGTSMVQKRTEKDEKKSPTSMEVHRCHCGRVYSHHSGLCRHKRSCTKEPVFEKEKNPEGVFTEEQLKVVSKMVQDACSATAKETARVMKENMEGGSLVGSINCSNNTTVAGNQYNIQLFLDEKCKDALTIQRFIGQLKPALEALEGGKVGAVTTALLRSLEPLKVTERPIHYAGAAGTWHVNDECKGWEEGDGANVVTKAEEAISKAWPTEFHIKHPEWEGSDKLGDMYVRLSSSAASDLTERDISGVLQEVQNKVTLNDV